MVFSTAHDAVWYMILEKENVFYVRGRRVTVDGYRIPDIKLTRLSVTFTLYRNSIAAFGSNATVFGSEA
jgi:hypothetical protein